MDIPHISNADINLNKEPNHKIDVSVPETLESLSKEDMDKIQKMSSAAALAQGQAVINMSKTSKLLSKCSDAQVATAKGAVKKVKVPSGFAKTKEAVLADINAELETRYLLGQLANKSAEHSAADIIELSPFDLGGIKIELKEKYGQKIQDKKLAEREQRAIAKANSIIRTKMLNLERFVAFVLPNEHYLVDEPPIKQRVPRIVCRDEGLEVYTQAYVDKIINSYDTEGLMKIIEAINTESIYNDLDAQQKALLTQEIKSHLEFLYHKKQYESGMGEGAAERSAKSILEEEERLSDINSEKETRYLRRQLSHKSAEKSAADIVKLNPYDLDAKKIGLQEKYADKVQERKENEEAQKVIEAERLEQQKIEEARAKRIQNVETFCTFLPFPAFIHVPKEVCLEQGMEAFVQAYVDNMIESYHPTWLVKVLNLIDNDDKLRNPLDDEQKALFREAIKSELEFINYKKQFESDLSKNAAKMSADVILENNPVDLGQRKIDLQEKFPDISSDMDE